MAAESVCLEATIFGRSLMPYASLKPATHSDGTPDAEQRNLVVSCHWQANAKAATSLAMRSARLILFLTSIGGCAAEPSASVRALAERLAVESGASSNEGSRARYVACGTEALSAVPANDISRALTAPDAPSIWAILGDDALNEYVEVCREADLKAGLQLGK